MKRKCDCCKQLLEESELEVSHDVPCYLFEGNRKGRSNQADKFGRRFLCKQDHKSYENSLMIYLRAKAYAYAQNYFKKEGGCDDTCTA